ncbi:MAG: hypothetical protein MHM6MM_000957 [Cercozoa sp. M6MM]
MVARFLFNWIRPLAYSTKVRTRNAHLSETMPGVSGFVATLVLPAKWYPAAFRAFPKQGILLTCVVLGMAMCADDTLSTAAVLTDFPGKVPTSRVRKGEGSVLRNVRTWLLESTAPAAELFDGVVVAPLGEELVFRGLLFRALSWFIPPLATIGAQAGAFGLVHPLPSQQFLATIGGLIYGTAYALTGRFWVPVLLHSVHNLMTLSTVATGWLLRSHALDLSAEHADLLKWALVHFLTFYADYRLLQLRLVRRLGWNESTFDNSADGHDFKDACNALDGSSDFRGADTLVYTLSVARRRGGNTLAISVRDEWIELVRLHFVGNSVSYPSLRRLRLC